MKVSEEKFLYLQKELLTKGELEARIVSDSMSPLIRSGDNIVIERLDSEPNPNDIIVFMYHQNLYCHIFLGVSQIEKNCYKTMGLNNDGIDMPIKREDILGIVTNYKLGFMSKLKLFLKLWRN